MSSLDSFAALRRANPRKDPELESDVRASAALEKRIVTTDPAPSASRRRRWWRTPRRRLTLIAVTGAIVLLGGTVAYGGLRFPGLANLKPVPTPPPMEAPDFQAKGFLNWEQYHDEYVAWTHKIELPPGATWRGCDPQGREPDPDGMTYSFYVGAGAMDAVWEGMGHWAIEWGAATKADDNGRAARAEAWVVHLRVLLRASKVGATSDESSDAVDAETARILDAAIAEAKKGHVDKLSHMDMIIGHTVPYATPSTSP